MPTITSDQTPIAKPRAISVELTTSYQTLIEASNFNTLRIGFAPASPRRFAPGVCEISSSLFLTNKSGTARAVTLRIRRAGGATVIVVPAMEVAPNDTLQVPLNGTFLLNNGTTDGAAGDILEALCVTDSAVDATISWTEGQAEDIDGSVA